MPCASQWNDRCDILDASSCASFKQEHVTDLSSAAEHFVAEPNVALHRVIPNVNVYGLTVHHERDTGAIHLSGALGVFGERIWPAPKLGLKITRSEGDKS